jgi:FlaG/FlaF family flagellin (archaellin)
VNASATAIARIATIALVLVLAAAFGLVVGNLLGMRDEGAAVGAGSMSHMRGFDWAQYHVQQGDVAAIGAPTYADPYRQIVEDAGNAGRSTESLTVPTPR